MASREIKGHVVDAFYHERLGVVVIMIWGGSLPSYCTPDVGPPGEPVDLKQLGDWLWEHYGAGIGDGPCWN